jgi:hypothetical protein
VDLISLEDWEGRKHGRIQASYLKMIMKVLNSTVCNWRKWFLYFSFQYSSYFYLFLYSKHVYMCLSYGGYRSHPSISVFCCGIETVLFKLEYKFLQWLKDAILFLWNMPYIWYIFILSIFELHKPVSNFIPYIRITCYLSKSDA